MNIQNMPPNHKVFRTGDHTAMIAFESGPFPDPKMVPRIHLYSRSQFHRPYLDEGKVFGHGPDSNYVLMVKAMPFSLIQVVEWRPELGHMDETSYRIGPDFEVLPISTNGKGISHIEVQALLHSSPVADAENLAIMESDTRLLFSGGHGRTCFSFSD